MRMQATESKGLVLRDSTQHYRTMRTLRQDTVLSALTIVIWIDE